MRTDGGLAPRSSAKYSLRCNLRTCTTRWRVVLTSHSGIACGATRSASANRARLAMNSRSAWCLNHAAKASGSERCQRCSSRSVMRMPVGGDSAFGIAGRRHGDGSEASCRSAVSSNVCVLCARLGRRADGDRRRRRSTAHRRQELRLSSRACVVSCLSTSRRQTVSTSYSSVPKGSTTVLSGRGALRVDYPARGSIGVRGEPVSDALVLARRRRTQMRRNVEFSDRVAKKAADQIRSGVEHR